MRRKAVFLDRDGVINEEWFNPATGEWESPLAPEDFVLREGALASLARLQALGYLLFLVSNQPSYAKGKTTLENLQAVHARFVTLLDQARINFQAFYYSYHHPEGIVPGYAGPSPDRKPSPYYLNLAVAQFHLERAACWMVGDRDTDVECGQRAGVRTIQIANPHAGPKAGKARPDFHAANLPEAVEIIARHG